MCHYEICHKTMCFQIWNLYKEILADSITYYLLNLATKFSFQLSGCSFCLWKLMMPHLKSIWQIILKISRKHSNWWYLQINKFWCTIGTWKKYFIFFSRRNMLLLKNVLLIDNFINHYQAVDFINKLLRQFFKNALIHFYRFLR